MSQKVSTMSNGAPDMLEDNHLIAAIDVGTTKVCTILGHRAGAKGIRVLAHSSVPCNGLSKGNVADVAATTKAIRRSVHLVQKQTGRRVESAFVGVTGSHIGFQNRRDQLSSIGKNGVITADDLARTPEPLAESIAEPGRQLIHAIRMSYTLDGESGIRNPLGMHSSSVEADTHLTTGGAAFVKRLVQAVEDAGIKIASLVLEPLASAVAVLTPEEKERGAVIVDIGGGTTDLVAFKSGRVCFSAVIPVAGFQFTNDIALTYHTPYEAAEKVKLEYASTDMQISGPNEQISLPIVGRDVELQIRRLDVCQLARERGQELARLVKLKLDEAELGEYRVVLTGGTSNLPGLAALMQRTLTSIVRQGVPDAEGRLPEELKSSAYATGVGILQWAATEYVPSPLELEAEAIAASNEQAEGWMTRLWRQFGTKLAPLALMATKKGRV